MQGFLHLSMKYSKCEWFCDGGNILTASDFDILSVSLLRTIFFEYSKCESVGLYIYMYIWYGFNVMYDTTCVFFIGVDSYNFVHYS